MGPWFLYDLKVQSSYESLVDWVIGIKCHSTSSVTGVTISVTRFHFLKVWVFMEVLRR